MVTDESGKEMASGFDGTIKVKIPNYRERIQMVQDMGFDDEKIGLEAGSKMIELVEKQVESVELTHDSGEVITSLDDLSYSREGSLLINEIGKTIMGGIPLGNGSKSP